MGLRGVWLVVWAIGLLAVSGNADAAAFRLAWDANQEPDLAGYNVYAKKKGDANGYRTIGPFEPGEIVAAGGTVVIEGFADYTKYQLYVTAIDDEGYESQPSNLVCAVNGVSCDQIPFAIGGGYEIESEIWIKAVLRVSGYPVTLVWKQIGADTTVTGDRVISGYFYADPADFAYGSAYNPEAFVKVYIGTDGWCGIAFSHVTVDPIDVATAHRYGGAADRSGTISLTNRIVLHEYTDVSIDAAGD